MLRNSVPKHPWLGLFLWKDDRFFGIIEDVSDSGEDTVYVQFVYNESERDYAYVKRNATTSKTIVYAD